MPQETAIKPGVARARRVPPQKKTNKTITWDADPAYHEKNKGPQNQTNKTQVRPKVDVLRAAGNLVRSLKAIHQIA